MAAEQPILLVAYGPFAGRGVNGSATLATAMDAEVIAGHPIRIAILPVVWGRPEAMVPPLIDEIQPCLVLGLGEGFPGRIAFEQQAVNRRSGRDERGQQPALAVIDADGPEARPSRLTLDLATLPPASVPVVLSQDAGTYLCNNLLWTTLGHGGRPTGFVHLPPQGETPSDRYIDDLRPVIRAILVQNVP